MGASGEHRPFPTHNLHVGFCPTNGRFSGPSYILQTPSSALTVQVHCQLGLFLIENVFKVTPALCGGIQKLLLGCGELCTHKSHYCLHFDGSPQGSPPCAGSWGACTEPAAGTGIFWTVLHHGLSPELPVPAPGPVTSLG